MMVPDKVHMNFLLLNIFEKQFSSACRSGMVNADVYFVGNFPIISVPAHFVPILCVSIKNDIRGIQFLSEITEMFLLLFC